MLYSPPLTFSTLSPSFPSSEKNLAGFKFWRMIYGTKAFSDKLSKQVRNIEDKIAEPKKSGVSIRQAKRLARTLEYKKIRLADANTRREEFAPLLGESPCIKIA